MLVDRGVSEGKNCSGLKVIQTNRRSGLSTTLFLQEAREFPLTALNFQLNDPLVSSWLMNVSSTKPSLLLTLSPHPLPLQGFYQPSGKRKISIYFQQTHHSSSHQLVFRCEEGNMNKRTSLYPCGFRINLWFRCDGAPANGRLDWESFFTVFTRRHRKEEVGPDPEIHFHPPSLCLVPQTPTSQSLVNGLPTQLFLMQFYSLGIRGL